MSLFKCEETGISFKPLNYPRVGFCFLKAPRLPRYSKSLIKFHTQKYIQEAGLNDKNKKLDAINVIDFDREARENFLADCLLTSDFHMDKDLAINNNRIIRGILMNPTLKKIFSPKSKKKTKKKRGVDHGSAEMRDDAANPSEDGDNAHHLTVSPLGLKVLTGHLQSRHYQEIRDNTGLEIPTTASPVHHHLDSSQSPVMSNSQLPSIKNFDVLKTPISEDGPAVSRIQKVQSTDSSATSGSTFTILHKDNSHDNIYEDYAESSRITSEQTSVCSFRAPKRTRKHKFLHYVQEHREVRGCNCKKSGCIKKYCECFSKGIPCTEKCSCCDCQNCSKQQE